MRGGWLLLAVGLVSIACSTLAVAGEPQNAVPRGDQTRWVTGKDYPHGPWRDDIMGSVSFRLIVNPQGRVQDCQIIKSSESAALDETTCTLLKRRGRFKPALDAEGRPTTGEYSDQVDWKIPS